MNIRRSCSIIVTGLACVVAAQAQTSQTTGAIRGTIKDRSGAPVKQATIQARNTENGFTRTAKTNDAGQYLMSMMPVGSYEVTVTATDLKTLKKDGLDVSLGEVTPLNFIMDVAAKTVVVEVTADISNVDVTQTSVASSVSTEMVAAIPVNGRNFTDLTQLTPGANTGAQDYRTVVEGARGTQNNLQIDGASFNSKFSGESRGGTRIPFAFGMGSIRELQVITNPFDCQYGDANGAVINAISKSGTNDITGEAMVLFRPQAGVSKIKNVPWDPDHKLNIPSVQERKFKRSTYAFNVGGPIIKDVLHYFVNAEYSTFAQTNTPSVALDSSNGNKTDFDKFWNGPARTLITGGGGQTLYQESISPWENSSKNLTVMARLDWNINSNHRANLRLNVQQYKGLNDIWSGSFKTNEAESNNSSSKYGSVSWVGEFNSTFGTSVNNEARIQISNERRPWTPNSTVAEIGVPGFYAGQSYLDPRDTDESLTQIIDTLSYFTGDWTFKAGLNFQDITYRNQFLQNQGGALVFGGSSAWNIANLWWAGTDPGALSTNPITYSGAYSYSHGWSTYGQRIATTFLQGEYAGLWQRRIKLTFGARFTREMWDDNPRPNAKVQGLDHMPDNSSMDPRFAFSIDLFGSGKTVLRGGLGSFSMANLGQSVASAFLQNGENSKPYQVLAMDHRELFFGEGGILTKASMVRDNRLQKLSDAQLVTLPTGTIQVTLIDPNFKQGQRQTATLQLEQDLGNNMTFSIKGTYSRFIHVQYWMPLNLGQVNPATGAVDTTGYYNDGYKYKYNKWSTATRPYHATIHGRNLDLSGYGNVQVAMSDGRARYRGLAVELNRKGGADQFGFMFNVTLSRSEDNNSNENSTAQSQSGNPLDPSNPLVMARSDNDQACRVNFSFYTPRYWGFRAGGAFSWSTGLPFTPRYSSDKNGDSFTNDAGPTGRNSARQPSRKTLSLNISRAFRLGGKRELSAEVLVYNPFNWANQSTSLTSFEASDYRKINTVDARTREVQGQLRFTF